jgi:inosose dehydratase
VSLELASGPVSWGVDFADSPANPPWPEVLDGIARAGYAATELGPIGYLPEDPARLAGELAARGLRVAGSFVFEPLHDPARLPEIAAVTRRTCRLIAGAGGRFLVVIDLVSPERAATAGRPEAAPRLAAPARRALVEGIGEVARIAREEFGLLPVLHPHAGTYVELADEIEDVMAAFARDELGLCLDTGHAALAGLDPVATYRRWADRVRYLHLKDVDPRVRERGLDFWRAVEAGVFCPVGAGVVDFAALAEALREHEFAGPATVEQDRRGPGDPVADLRASRAYLERLGLGAPLTTKASTR